MIDIYNVKVHFDSLYHAGVKRSLIVYTLKITCVVGFFHQVLADILCVKTNLGPFIEVFIWFTKAL